LKKSIVGWNLTSYVLVILKLLTYLNHLLTMQARVLPDMYRVSCESWYRDPLAHPSVERMSERELADLPFDRGRMPFRSRDG
jgi:hypothetical protein